MRLIDADELLESFRKCYSGHMGMENSDSTMMIKSICKIINEQKTAYDIENVVKKLEEKKEQYVLKAEKWKNKGDETENKLMNIAMTNMASCYKDAVEIVKGCEEE